MDYRADHSLAGLAMRTALVTGATGFLGGALARQLASDGIQVRAVTRTPDQAGELGQVAEVVQGDIIDHARMQDVTQGCDVVFHAAVSYGKRADQIRTNVEGTRNVALAAAAAGVQRLVHVSSIAVYGFRVPDVVSEDIPPNPNRDPYNITKAQAEAIIGNIAASQGLPCTIIRPGMIYGPGSGMWTRNCFRLARINPTPWPGDGSGTVAVIHVDDVVRQMILQATAPAAVGKAFHATADPPPTWRDFLGGYAALAGHDRWLALPPILARIVAPVLELALSANSTPKDLPDLAAYYQRRVTYKMDRARDLLGWQPQVNLQAGIDSCALWLREQGLL